MTASDPALRVRELEAENRRLQQEIARLQEMLGLRAAPPATAPAPGAPAQAPRPLRILLADDHPVQSALTLGLLKTLGYAADVVRNGQEVLYALEKKNYDVVLMDVQMPVLNGFETTAEIRARYPEDKRPRIIALTARNLERDRSECLAAGMDDFIGKPVALRILDAKLRGRGDTLVAARTFQELAEAAGPDTAREVVDMFLRDVPQAIKSMREAVAAGDSKALRSVAHPQVSVCHALGVESMSVLARQLEKLAEAGDLGGAPALLDDFEALLAPVELELRKLQGAGEPAPAPAAPQAPRLLVVEDNAVSLKITLSLLEGLGHRADSAGSGREAIRKLEQQHYDLVLMDVLLPIMDGLAATRQICARWPRQQRPRIVGMSGLDADADRQAGMEAGMDAYLTKPLKRSTVEATLKRFGIGTGSAAPTTATATAAAAHAASAEPTVVPPPAPVLLDESVLRQWAQGKPATALDLIDEFVRDLRPKLVELRRGATDGNARALRHAAHALKSASIGIGAVEMATLAADLEARGRSGQLADANSVVDRIIAMREPLTERLKELRRQFA